MVNISSSVLRQASRLPSNSCIFPRQAPYALARVPVLPLPRVPVRSYVAATKKDNAQVADAKVETAIRLDKKDFEKAGLSLNAQDGSSATVSPMAGK